MRVSFEASETFYFEFRALPGKFRKTFTKLRYFRRRLPDGKWSKPYRRDERRRLMTGLEGFCSLTRASERDSSCSAQFYHLGAHHRHSTIDNFPFPREHQRHFREISRAARSPQIAIKNLRNSHLGQAGARDRGERRLHRPTYL